MKKQRWRQKKLVKAGKLWGGGVVTEKKQHITWMHCTDGALILHFLNYCIGLENREHRQRCNLNSRRLLCFFNTGFIWKTPFFPLKSVTKRKISIVKMKLWFTTKEKSRQSGVFWSFNTKYFLGSSAMQLRFDDYFKQVVKRNWKCHISRADSEHFCRKMLFLWWRDDVQAPER